MTHEERLQHFEQERQELMECGISAAEYIDALVELTIKWRVSI